MKVELSEIEAWFINLAITHKEEILPLSEKALDDKNFEEDYGVTKAEVIESLENLRKKLN